MSESGSGDFSWILASIKKLGHFISLLSEICVITANATDTFELDKWYGVLAVWWVAGRMQKIVVSVSVFIKNASGNMVILERDMKVKEVDRVSGDFSGEFERRGEITDKFAMNCSIVLREN